MRVLLASFYFPPAAGGGVQRQLKLAEGLADRGADVTVLTPRDPRWMHRDETLPVSPRLELLRTAYLGPRGRRPAEDLYGTSGLRRLLLKAALQPRRLLVPDEHSPWLLTAVPVAVNAARRRGFDVVITSSPPPSAHVIGAAVSAATGTPWIADLRDSIAAKSDRAYERLAVRLKEQTGSLIAELVARRAAAITAVTPTIAEEIEARKPRGRVATIPNGIDFDDYDGLEYEPDGRFRLAHTGSFFGSRSARPVLEAISRLGPEDDVVVRFAGDFRSSDRDYAQELGVADRIELLGFKTRRETLELQRGSDALLLLLPEIGERGLDVPSAKLFEYLAARRPIIAAAPPEGTAARIVREANAGVVVAPDDVDALTAALRAMLQGWRNGGLPDRSLSGSLVERYGREARIDEFWELIGDVATRRAAPAPRLRARRG